jgi:flagellar biosynthesis protein FlhB
MADDERSIPPSRARLAAAARAGVFARSRLLVAGVVLAAAGATGYLLSARLGAALVGLVEEGLLDAVRLRGDPGAALLAGIGRGLLAVLPLILVPGAVGALAAVLPALAARRGSGSTSVPLPVRPSRASRGVLAAFAVALFALLALVIVRSYGGELALALRGEGSGGRWVFELLAVLVATAGATAALAGLADLALERASLLRALALRPADAVREERAASGDPRVRSRVRARARQEAGSR